MSKRMNLLDKNISRAEKLHFDNVFAEVNRHFKDIWLPSHDVQHHVRVWSLAKELLHAYTRYQVTFTNEFVEGVLIASLFHDVGLTRILGFEHGKESAKIARNFLNDGTYSPELPVTEILEAIERHDHKSYLNTSFDTNHPSIYDLLTVADDLDAFGALGLYRYFEIYHLREIDIGEMPELIKKNITKRFSFVEKVIGIDEELREEHYKRCQLALAYCEKLSFEDISLIVRQIDQKKILEYLPDGSCFLQQFVEDARGELAP